MQLEFSEIRKGSVVLIITEAISHFKDVTPLAIFWLFLKYLPGGIKTLSEATKNFADSYKAIQEGKLVRENRKQLKERLKHDEALQELDDKQINELIALLADLETSERRKLPASTRFAKKYVKSVKISLKERGK
jgi:transketolase